MNSKSRRRLLGFRLRQPLARALFGPDLVLVTSNLWRLLALRNAFLHEKSVTLSGLLVFTSILWGSFNGVATGKRSRPFWSFQQVENSSAGFFLPARRTVRAVKILA